MEYPFRPAGAMTPLNLRRGHPTFGKPYVYTGEHEKNKKYATKKDKYQAELAQNRVRDRAKRKSEKASKAAICPETGGRHRFVERNEGPKLHSCIHCGAPNPKWPKKRAGQ